MHAFETRLLPSGGFVRPRYASSSFSTSTWIVRSSSAVTDTTGVVGQLGRCDCATASQSIHDASRTGLASASMVAASVNTMSPTSFTVGSGMDAMLSCQLCDAALRPGRGGTCRSGAQ